MERLRLPFFLATLGLLLLVVLVELGTGVSLKTPQASINDLTPHLSEFEDVDRDDVAEKLNALERGEPPGWAIPSMAVLDGLLLFNIGLMGLALLLPDRLHGRIQGIVTLIVTLLLAILSIVLIVLAILLLVVMTSLFLAPPWGTITYLVVWGFFERGGATAALGILLLLKIAALVCLVLSHQGFLKGKGLLAFFATSLVANVVVAFLHGIVPIFLVSITDVIGAIIVLVLGLIWAVLMLVGSIVSIVKVLRGSRAAKEAESRRGDALPVAG